MKLIWKAFGLSLACVLSAIIGAFFGSYLTVTDDDFLQRARYMMGKTTEPTAKKTKSIYGKNQIGFR